MSKAKEIKYGFRMVHIHNIAHICKHGFVHSFSPQATPDYISIGDQTIIERRKEKIQNYRLADYIPFYLGPRSPMLYVIQHGFNGVTQYNAEEIVYCIIKISDVISNNLDCMYTDGHALDMLTTYYPGSQLNDLNAHVNFEEVYSRYWNKEEDRDFKRRKEAELLLKDEIPPNLICGYVVYNEKVQQQLLSLGIPKSKIIIKPDYYF